MFPVFLTSYYSYKTSRNIGFIIAKTKHVDLALGQQIIDSIQTLGK